jgi:chromosome segregation ATPase
VSFPDVDPVQAAGALLGAVGFGGILVKLIDKIWPSGSQRLKDGADVRQEIWERLAASEARIDRLLQESEKRINDLTKELDEWKLKFFKLLEDYHTLKAENHSIREENHKLLSQFTAVQVTMQRLEKQIAEMGDAPRTPSSLPGSGPTILDEVMP